jgi:predicted RecB family endonuclease
LITARQTCFAAALIAAGLPDPARLQRLLSFVCSSGVSVFKNLPISALQIATVAWLPGATVDVAALVDVDVDVDVDVLAALELELLEVLGLLDVLAELEELGVLEVLCVFAAALVELDVVVEELLPHADTTIALSTAPISSRYGLRVIDYPRCF